jgi:hypothetical protein
MNSKYTLQVFFRRCLALIIFLIPACSVLGQAQNTNPAGQIIDAQSKMPVAGASIFINNSTYGMTSREDGTFDWSPFPPPPFDLTITAIGYESAVIPVTAGTSNSRLTIPLKARAFDLDEVTIKGPEKDGWEKYGQQFTEDFIGYSSFARECDILNKEVLEFRYNEGVLRVTADKPLKIRNKATGYLVTYWLEDFELDQNTRRLYYKGYTQFASLDSKRKGKVKKWETNRLSAYKGSIYHFMRSVYQGNTSREGFEIRKLKRVSQDEIDSYIPIKTDTLLFSDRDKFKNLLLDIYGPDADPVVLLNTLTAVKKWKEDTTIVNSLKIMGTPPADSSISREFVLVKDKSNREQLRVNYFEVSKTAKADNDAGTGENKLLTKRFRLSGQGVPASSHKKYDILLSTVFPLDSFVYRRDAQSVQFRVPEYLHITYLNEKEEEDYAKRAYLSGGALPSDQASIISISNKEGITIYPQGSFQNSYDLFVEKYWSYEKLDKLLPLDFEP